MIARFTLSARHRWLAALLPLVALIAGCTANGQRQASMVTPPAAAEIQVTNFDAVPCDQIWSASDSHALNGPLYWLRAMDCGVRLSPADARAEAKKWTQPGWQSAFKQGILLDNGNVTPLERRAFLSHLDDYLFDYPAGMRPLIQLWRDQQSAQLQLADERMRYAQLQEKSDGQLDGLRQQQITLQQALNQTQRKLDSLTDIERKLSSRRSADGGDTGHGSGKPAADDAAGDDVTP